MSQSTKVELVGGPHDGVVIDWAGPLSARISMKSVGDGGPSAPVAEYVVWYGRNRAGHEAYLFNGYKEASR